MRVIDNSAPFYGEVGEVLRVEDNGWVKMSFRHINPRAFHVTYPPKMLRREDD